MILSLSYMLTFILSLFFSERLMQRSNFVSGLFLGVAVLFWALFLNSIPAGDL